MSQVCEGRNCGKPATYAVHVDMATRLYLYCDDCRAAFEVSADRLPVEPRRDLLARVRFVKLEASNA